MKYLFLFLLSSACFADYANIGSVTDVTAVLPISSTGGSNPEISCRVANGSQSGCLSSSSYALFNSKQDSGNYITGITGDLSASGPGSVAGTVNFVGGSSAASVNSATVLANAATNADTVSTIVKRDSSGNFSAGIISAALNGNASTVTTNANLTGPITSVGNATSVASQTGTGSQFVMAASPTISTPTITTSAVDPLLMGGSAIGSSLSLQSTSGVGTTDFINFLVGNNGATESARIIHSGNIGVGTTTPVNKLDVSGTMAVGSYAGVNTATSNGLIVSGNVGIDTNAPAAALHIRTPFGGQFVRFDQDDGGNRGGIYNGNGQASMQLQDGAQVPRVSLNTNGVSYLTGGNLGIGSTTPAQVLDVAGLIKMAVQGSGVTPTCGATQNGTLALTNAYILCVCNSSSFVKVSDGSTACTF